jgi:LytR cell envelope-related transcriptional attenuator
VPPSGRGDWSFPAVEPPAEAVPHVPSPDRAGLTADRPPLASEPAAGDDAWLETQAAAQGAHAVVPEHPSARLPRPRRTTTVAGPRGPVSLLSAAAGAGLSVLGVLVLIVTLLWFDGGNRGPRISSPVVSAAGGAATSAPVLPPAAVPAPVATTPTSPTATPPTVPVRPRVTVLNNSRVRGLADRAAADLRRAGWPVASVGNYRGRLATSTVYYPAGQAEAARRLATRYPSVGAVLPRPAGLPGSGLTLVVTRDFRTG